MTDDQIFAFVDSAPRFLVRAARFGAGVTAQGHPSTVERADILGHIGRCPDYAFGNVIVTNRLALGGDIFVTVISPHHGDRIPDPSPY